MHYHIFLYYLLTSLFIINTFCLKFQCKYYYFDYNYCDIYNNDNDNDNNNLLKKWKDCQQCNNNNCKECPAESLLKEVKILSPIDTINNIVYNKKSIARFGNGEFDMIFGFKLGFQKYDKNLVKRLKEVLNSDIEGLIIGIDNSINITYIDLYINHVKKYWKYWVNKNKYRLIKLLKPNYYYGSTRISRFYYDMEDKSKVFRYVQKLKEIWDGKDIIIIEGEKSRFGVGNNLLDNAKSIKRILCPPENAFGSYDIIYNEALKIEKSKLILIALGPTATVLAYDLHNVGYQAIDIGHADIEYEWFLRNATKKIKIENKYTNEVVGGRTNIKNFIEDDEEYYYQIMTIISN